METTHRIDRATSTVDLLAAIAGSPGAATAGLAELAAMEVADIVSRFGLAEPAARRLFAAFELARRRELEARPARPLFDAPDKVFAWARPLARDLVIEVFHALVLDARNRLVADEVVSRGILTASLVHPREVFRPAIQRMGAAIVVVHNHPSGDPTPSRDDDAITERLARGGELLGIPLLDHVVVGDGAYWSYREHGALGGSGDDPEVPRPSTARGFVAREAAR